MTLEELTAAFARAQAKGYGEVPAKIRLAARNRFGVDLAVMSAENTAAVPHAETATVPREESR